MAELKTRPTGDDVVAYLESIEDEQRRADCFALLELLQRVTGAEPVLWAGGIIGFGDYHFHYASGREGEWFEAGFASRKANIAVYVMPGLEPFAEILERLGKHSIGVGCLYIKRLADIDLNVLEELLSSAVHELRAAGS
jgi:hypothetical protein